MKQMREHDGRGVVLSLLLSWGVNRTYSRVKKRRD